jgi:hypothetical protein
MDQLVRPQACNDFDPPVESKIVRIKGAKRGCVLISFSSLMEHINALPAQKEEVQQKQAKEHVSDPHTEEFA